MFVDAMKMKKNSCNKEFEKGKIEDRNRRKRIFKIENKK